MKKIIISSKTLKLALDKLGQAVIKKSVLPVLSNMLCRVGTNEVELFTSDLELTIKYKCECETEGSPFDILLPFDFIKSIVTLSKHVPVVIEVAAESARITVTNDVYELNTLDKVADFPTLPALPKKNFISLNGTFIDWLNKALMTVSEDDTRPSMTKICLDVVSNGVTMVSTDAHYLFTHTFPVESKAEDQLLISTKIAKALDGFESTEIFWNSKHIGFHSNNITVIATRPDDKYPAYKNVIPDYPANLLLDREEVLNALQRCCLSSNASKQTVILLHEEAGTIRFIADDIDFNRKIQVDVNGAYRGPVDRIAVSADRLLTMMKQVNYDKINLHIHHQDKAVLLTSESDAEYLALLMPLHIN